MAIELIQGDCMEYMATLPDKAFDVCVTSPPYNLNLRLNKSKDGYMSDWVGGSNNTKYKNYGDNLPMEDYETFLINTIQELLRVCSIVFINIQLATGNKRAVFNTIGRLSNQLKEVVIWDKINAEPAIMNGVLNSQFEFILIFGEIPISRMFNGANFKRGELSNLWRIKKQKSADADHKASFPVSLVKTILSNFAPTNASIFDPFLGTGTSAIAAHDMGFDFVGIELDPDYYAAAVKRFNNAKMQTKLF